MFTAFKIIIYDSRNLGYTFKKLNVNEISISLVKIIIIIIIKQERGMFFFLKICSCQIYSYIVYKGMQKHPQKNIAQSLMYKLAS